MALTLFSFGYYGWGNSTTDLVKAVDSVERARGFKPPVFVDIRYQRSVRAPGFNGTAFAKLLGDKRYEWLKQLGNKAIGASTGPRIQIAEPRAVHDLLDIANGAAESGRRVIFYCGCQWPRESGCIYCHRSTVTTLAIRAAKTRGLSIEVAEWPGGKPLHLKFRIDDDQIPTGESDWFMKLNGQLKLPRAAAIPWGSTVRLQAPTADMLAVVGPAIRRRREWQLPIFWKLPGGRLAQIKAMAKAVRRSYGFDPRRT